MVLFAEFPVAELALVLALGLAIGILLKRSRRYLSGPSARPIATVDRPQPYDDGSDKIPPAPMTRWEVQMHETARDLLAEMDTKAALLQQLIHDADRAASRLEKALEAGTSAGPDELPAETQAQALASAAEGAHREGNRAASTPEQRYEEIYTLADYGFPASEIAHRLGMPVGEVELILALRAKDR